MDKPLETMTRDELIEEIAVLRSTITLLTERVVDLLRQLAPQQK